MSFNKNPGERYKQSDLGNLSLIRYKFKGERFELVVDPEKAWLYQQGDDVPLDEIIESFTIFDNFSKGLKSGEQQLEDTFGTTEERKIAETMLKKGELLITHEMRKRFLQEKIDEIVAFLVKNTINPKTRTPHTPERIEKAIDESGVNISRDEPTKEQAIRIIKEINSILPIKMEVVNVQFKIPSQFAGSLYSTIRNEGEVVSENWENDGSLTLVSQIPAGVQAKLMEEVLTKSKGKSQIQVIKRN